MISWELGVLGLMRRHVVIGIYPVDGYCSLTDDDLLLSADLNLENKGLRGQPGAAGGKEKRYRCSSLR